MKFLLREAYSTHIYIYILEKYISTTYFLLFQTTLYASKARACNSEIDVRTELPSFCWHKWIYVVPSISHMASLWWHAIRVSPLETYSAASFGMSLLLSRRYSVFGKLLKRRHKSVVDGDARSGYIFESNRE